MTRSFFAPEIVQTSAMDCGPASLKCLLEGLGVHVSYGRLREACQTDVDGTSIDTIEEIGQELGLDCEQVMIPVDHLLLPEASALPAIVVVRLPNGFAHFVVAWRRHGPFLQVMDPSSGRLWTTGARFLDEVYVHTTPVPAAAFRDWARSEDFLRTLRGRLGRLGCLEDCRSEIESALADPGWRSIAALDAAVRMTSAVVRAGGLARGAESARTIAALVRDVRAGKAAIPDTYFAARSAPQQDAEEEQVLLRGAVLVRARGDRARPQGHGEEREERPRSPELVAALAELPARPAKHLLTLLGADGIWSLPVLTVALCGAVLGAALEVVLLRSLFDVGHALGLVQHRLAAMSAVIVFGLLLFALEWPIVSGVYRLGRWLEARLRMAFLDKIPRLNDRYFQSRPISDMAERSHAVHAVRSVPDLGGQVVRAACDLWVTAAAISWIDPPSAPWAIATAVVAAAIPFGAQPAIVERSLRARSHLGALSRFYLDTLLGLAPVRTHGAERSIRREHETLLVEWARSALSAVGASVTADALQAIAAYALTVPLLLRYIARTSEPGAALVLVYWALNLPSIGQELALALRQYPEHRNRTLRLLEPLGAPEDTNAPHIEAPPARTETELGASGVALAFEHVGVVTGGHTILQDIDARIDPGMHVAIVGASGSGKSSLLGTLLGWHRVAAGRVLVDGRTLDSACVAALRRQTAWVDPGIQLWNRSLLENVCFGQTDARSSFAPILEAADLHDLLQNLPDGLQTSLGEGGGLVSGGEGQRVRLARALMCKEARLVLLDEPFRGLDGDRRHQLIERARVWWNGATLLCVTHDVGETRAFDRVLVLDGGTIVQAGPPSELAADPGSPYAQMLAAEEELRVRTWADPVWRRLRIDRGRIHA